MSFNMLSIANIFKTKFVISEASISKNYNIINDVTLNKYNAFSEFTLLEKVQIITFIIWLITFAFTFYRTIKSKKIYKEMQKSVVDLEKLIRERNEIKID